MTCFIYLLMYKRSLKCNIISHGTGKEQAGHGGTFGTLFLLTLFLISRNVFPIIMIFFFMQCELRGMVIEGAWTEK